MQTASRWVSPNFHLCLYIAGEVEQSNSFGFRHVEGSNAGTGESSLGSSAIGVVGWIHELAAVTNGGANKGGLKRYL
jgi:hypothetical protein